MEDRNFEEIRKMLSRGECPECHKMGYLDNNGFEEDSYKNVYCNICDASFFINYEVVSYEINNKTYYRDNTGL